MKKIYVKTMLPALLLFLAQPVIAAQEESYPKVQGEISVEVENDNTYNSDESDNELNDLYLTVDSTVQLLFNQRLSLEGNLVFEPVLDPQPSKDREFEDHGLYLSSLVLQWQEDSFTVFGGKFTPVFGIGWDRAAGIYGADFADDYEISEQVGMGGAYTFSSTSSGEHTLSLSSFWADTSSFSDSIITRRERTKKSDGGVGNTEDLSSFAIALDGGRFASAPDFSYHLAYIHQAKGETENEEQQGIALALEYPIIFSEISITPLVEFVHFNNADGSSDRERRYLTTSLAAEYRDYNLALAYSNRSTTEPANPDIDDNLFQISAGYAFENGISVDIGWKSAEEEDVRADTAGIVVGYTMDF